MARTQASMESMVDGAVHGFKTYVSDEALRL